ncbi:MAG: lysozyme inhibitor LprI family protein [Usitatibacter sp.]
MRTLTAILAGLAMGAIEAPAQDYPTPSFDCANTTTQQELRICRSPELSELDGRHAALVERAIRASPDREKTRAEMDAWLERVRNPCQSDACLTEAYASHIRELERTVPPPAPPPAFTAPVGPAAAPVAKLEPRATDAMPDEDDDDDDEAEDSGWADYAIAFGLAALAIAFAAFLRAARRARVNASAARDASSGRP